LPSRLLTAEGSAPPPATKNFSISRWMFCRSHCNARNLSCCSSNSLMVIALNLVQWPVFCNVSPSGVKLIKRPASVYNNWSMTMKLLYCQMVDGLTIRENKGCVGSTAPDVHSTFRVLRCLLCRGSLRENRSNAFRPRQSGHTPQDKGCRL
jgi:hypothetical protein